MKKTIVILSAVLALVACSKETPANQNDSAIDASKVVFNITVNHSGDTKAVKTGWTSGDKVFLFFEDNTTAYVTMSYDGSDWTPAISSSALSLSASGKKVTAVYLPFNTDTPTYDSGWVFESKYAYYMTAEGVDYTVTTDPSTDISTLCAVLDMNAPDDFVQFLLPEASPVAVKYALMQASVTPVACGKITPGGVVAQETKTTGYPMDAMTVSGEGYYFYGTIAASVANPTFYLVEKDPTYGYAIGTQKKDVSATLNARAAIKFTSAFDAQEPWVDLGLDSGIKWATGNASGHIAGSGSIVSPTEYGDYYSWMRLDEMSSSYDFYDNGSDTATQLLGSPWRMPTKNEFIELCGVSGEKAEWNSTLKGILVTGSNGLVVFFPAAGQCFKSKINHLNTYGYYWSSDLYIYNSAKAYFLYFTGSVGPSDETRDNGHSVRPVRN